MTEQNDIGQRIKYLRKVHFCETSIMFGARLGISQSQVSSIERNNKNISIKALKKLSDLGVSADWVLTGKGSIFKGAIPDRETIQRIRNLYNRVSVDIACLLEEVQAIEKLT